MTYPPRGPRRHWQRNVCTTTRTQGCVNRPLYMHVTSMSRRPSTYLMRARGQHGRRTISLLYKAVQTLQMQPHSVQTFDQNLCDIYCITSTLSLRAISRLPGFRCIHLDLFYQHERQRCSEAPRLTGRKDLGTPFEYSARGDVNLRSTRRSTQ